MSLKDDRLDATTAANTNLTDLATNLNVIRNGIIQARQSQRSADFDNALAIDRLAIAISRRMRGLGLGWLVDNIETSPASAGANWADEVTAAITRLVP